MKKSIFLSVLLTLLILSFSQIEAQTINNKEDITIFEKGGWKIINILNTSFSATFIDNFESNESSSNWLLQKDKDRTIVASSTIENQRLKIKFNSTGRIRVPIAEAPMNLSKNNFDIISVFDKSCTSLYQGVIFGYKDDRNYSSITFSSQLKKMVFEKNEDGILAGDDHINGIYAIENYDNELRIKKENGIISIYFNGVKAYEINEVNQPGNGVGVIAGGNERMNLAIVKYFSVNIILPDELTFGLDENLDIISVEKVNGVYSVPVELNGVLKIDFIFDSGASDVSISPDVALTLLRTGTIKDKDWLEGAYYQFADGSTSKSKRFKLSSIKIGKKEIKNVICSISNSIEAPMLLGQSVLSKFGKYTFDNVNQKLIIE